MPNGARAPWPAACGRSLREPQMDAKQIGSNLILPAFELVECFQMFAQRLPQPKDIGDHRHRCRQPPQLKVIGQGIGHEAIGRKRV